MDPEAKREFQERARQVFGDNLRRLRQKAGLSQEALGERAGLHRTHIGYLENGDRLPKLDTIYILAEALDVDAGELLAGFKSSRATTEGD
ncbi:MAG TPA: helix-turn-helix transcriptional regulator [Solirubrobacterales bacterium]|nr:helix-turn-helix transcriptional regulator [Solirubrobacterales bacterium]